MNKEVGRIFYEQLKKIEKSELDPVQQIKSLNTQLNQLFLFLSKEENIQFATLFARIAFVTHKHGVSKGLQWRIHNLRKVANAVAYEGSKPSKNEFLIGYRTLSETIAVFFDLEIPEEISNTFLDIDVKTPTYKPFKEKLPKLKVIVLDIHKERDELTVQEEGRPGENLRVKFHKAGSNEIFYPTFERICLLDWKGAILNLLQVNVDDHQVLHPQMVILEPDFLVDVSSIAECFHGFGRDPFIYLLKKYLPFTPTPALMIGNIANYFLDELMHNPDAGFQEVFPKVFRLNPLNFSIFGNREIKEMMAKSQAHFVHLKALAKEGFKKHGIEPEACYLEPSFLSEKYGIQGRLDVWYKDDKTNKSAIVELKSGKPFSANKYGISANHYIQTLLYDLLVRSVYGNTIDPTTYILYSGLDVDQLKYATPVQVKQHEALEVRNQLVLLEKYLSELDKEKFSIPTILDRLGPDVAPQIKGFLRRDLQRFKNAVSKLDKVERKYFLAFSAFLAREQKLAKTGQQGNHKINGLASIWLDPEAEKVVNYELLSDLAVSVIDADSEEPVVTFAKGDQTNPLANFREGDIAVVYPKVRTNDTALSHQIFKCSVVRMTKDSVTIRLRSRQFNSSIFELDCKWNLEHDLLDSSFVGLYRSLYAFIAGDKRKRDLILTVKAPKKSLPVQFDFNALQSGLSGEQNMILQKALGAEDYFLLVGPPGTGKTKFMLCNMVRYLLQETDENVLLLAYTNRAVDEMCEAIEDFAADDYIRIGSRASTDSKYHKNLFSEKIKSVHKRAELKTLIGHHRIVLSTVASMSSKHELFKIKRFKRVIIDEASQISEPALVGLLGGNVTNIKTKENPIEEAKPIFQQFILIGDHKQLPAVVMQPTDLSSIEDDDLIDLGLTNRRNSLFERLFFRAKANGWSWAYDELSHQGRMHQDIVDFPSQFFYDTKLLLLPEGNMMRSWQEAKLGYLLPENSSDLMQKIANQRFLYFATQITKDGNNKTNESEAKLIGELVCEYYQLYQHNKLDFNPSTIGVITPYRAQIANIRKVLTEYKLGFENITVDTVERYQGGARDIVLISLCTNSAYQMKSLVSLSDDGLVDRKLNVALTRARHHLVVLGNEDLLRSEPVYTNYWIIY